jgi:electron transfer flavoprotein alpha subunit
LEKVIRETVDDLMREGFLGDWEAEPSSGVPPGPIRNNPELSFWVWAEIIEGDVRPVAFELLGRAVQLANESGGEVAALVVGPDVRRHADLLAAYGADKVYVAENFDLPEYATEPYARIVGDAIATHKPYVVLMPSTANGRDLAPRVAARLNVGLTGDILDLSLDRDGRVVQLKPAFGGNIVAPILTKTVPVMATVRPGMLEPVIVEPRRQAHVISVPVTDISNRLVIVGTEKTTDEGVHLDDAAIVIGIGTGVGGEANLPKVEEFCRVVDGHFGATRKVVDQGWLPRQLQIGLTGRTVAPHLYIALGVKGAFNHTVGIQRAGTILAINSDPNADIFKICDYGIVGDWQEIVNELMRVVSEKKRELNQETI